MRLTTTFWVDACSPRAEAVVACWVLPRPSTGNLNIHNCRRESVNCSEGLDGGVFFMFMPDVLLVFNNLITKPQPSTIPHFLQRAVRGSPPIVVSRSGWRTLCRLTCQLGICLLVWLRSLLCMLPHLLFSPRAASTSPWISL